MKTGKITKSEFTKPYDGPNGRTFYHNISFEGDSVVYNIGSKEQNPSFLAVGQTLTYEIPNSAKPNSIKRVKEDNFTKSGTGYNGSFKSDNGVGMQIGNALNVTALLIAHGKVELKDLESTARRVIEISNKLKEENTK